MGVFRSEVILHKRVRIPTESVMEVMDALGKSEVDSIEFIDLNKDNLEAKKNFAGMLKRCEEMDKKILNFEFFAKEFKENIIEYKQFKHFLSDLDNDKSQRDRRFGTYFDEVENEILEEERRIIDLVDSYTKIKESMEVLIEKKSVFDKSFQLIRTNPDLSQRLEQEVISNSMIEEGNQGLNFLAGVIKADDDLKMKRMIFRASKGRAIATFFDLENSEHIPTKESSNKIKKKIFTVFFQGGNENVLLHKLLRICDIFGASRYNIPRRDEIHSQVQALEAEMYEKKDYLKQAEISIKNYLRDKLGSDSQPGKLQMYKMYFRKEKMIYNNLNKCLLRDNFIDGEVWILEKDYNNLKQIMREMNKDDSRMPTSFIDLEESNLPKPTYIHCNEVLWPFQEITNTYGVPRYMEINPSYFNVISFPFLFGVMFGDIGHGLTLLILAIYLCFKAEEIKRDRNSSLKMAVKARYILLLMGIFAFYSGWIYNDFLSLPLPIFGGSCYEDKVSGNSAYAIKTSHDCVYPIGIDPKWRIAKNELSFVNSFKMKLSVILGVSHMLFGIILKGMNDFHFQNKVGIFFEFIPQFIFMSILFGYMNVMIFIKWATDWSYNLNKAPSIIALMMNIFLKLGSVGNKPLWGGKNENGDYVQEKFHMIILIICVCLIPIMLLPKPIILYCKNSRKERPLISISQIELDDKFDIDNNQPHVSYLQANPEVDETHSFSELFIHQAIETIEFVLGTVSNTASYLRLWALSLAHAELAKVFFEKSLLSPIQDGNYASGIFSIFFGFIIFANATLLVLLCMDFMECFLHTLRLHWVEFQNKFYKADGYKFNPYSFKYIIEGDA